MQALRPFSFPISLLPALIAIGVICRNVPMATLHWPAVPAVLILVLSLHAAGNLINDYFDVDRQVDTLTDDADRPGRLLLEGKISRQGIVRAITICLIVGSIPGVYLTWLRGLPVAGFVALALFGLYAYTGPPFSIKYRAAGELLVFLIFGPSLMAACAYATSGHVGGKVLASSVPIGMGITAVLVGNNLRDVEEDRQSGITTLPMLVGIPAARTIYVACLFLFVCGLSLLAWVDILPPLLLPIPLALLLHAPTIVSLFRERRIPNIDVKTARFISLVMSLVFVSLFLPLP